MLDLLMAVFSTNFFISFNYNKDNIIFFMKKRKLMWLLPIIDDFNMKVMNFSSSY